MRLTAAIVVALLFVPCLAAAQAADEVAAFEALRRYQSGREYFHQEAWKKAEREFVRAIALDPLLAAAHYDLGRTHMALGRYRSAVRAFLACRDAYAKINALADGRRAAELARQTEARARASGARAQDTRGKDAAATPVPAEPQRQPVPGGEAVYSRLEPPAELWLALGSAYFRLDDVAEAERHYRAAVAAKPDLGEAHNNLAVICMLTGRLDDAVRAVERAERAGFGVRPGLKAELAARQSRTALPTSSSR